MKRAAIAAVLSLSACTGAPQRPAAASADALLARDREFDAYTAAHGVAEGFHAFVSDDVVSLLQGADAIVGRDALFARQSKMPKGVELRWQPRAADIAASGELGYTWGTFTLRTTSESGALVEQSGKYCTIWKKQADGSWKAVLDVGNTSAPPPAHS